MIERQDSPGVRCIIHVSCFRIKAYREEVIGVGPLCEYSSSTVQKMRLGVDLPDGVIVFNKSHSTAFPTKQWSVVPVIGFFYIRRKPKMEMMKFCSIPLFTIIGTQEVDSDEKHQI